MPTTARRCAHCGLDAGPSPRSDDGRVFCCAGCQAIYAILHAEGLGRFYEAGGVGALPVRAERRAGDAGRPAHPVLEALEAAGEVELDVAGMRCASCAWLIETWLARRAGVRDVRASYATGTCRLSWSRDHTSLARLLAELERIGYRARPSQPALRLAQQDREGRALLARVGISAFLAMNVMLAAVALYAGEFQGIGAGARSALRVLSALLAAPVVLWGGWPFLRGAVAALRARRATMDTLVALGAATAYSVSLYGLAAGGPVFFDCAAAIVTLVLVGRLLEHGARRRGSRSIRSLLALVPDVARLVTPDGPASVDAAALAVGQLIEVRPGERVAADGVVEEGTSALDESTLTGEAAPRVVGPGAEVSGGTVNGWGVLCVRTTRVGADTAAARIATAVQRAMETRAPAERLADRMMGWFVPVVLGLAALAAGAWWLGGAGLPRALLVGVAVLVVACPCALGLATPAALAVAIGEAASRGIFFRGADVLERAAAVREVAFDKTGTLSDGRLAVTGVLPAPGWTEDALLRAAAGAEAHAGHSLGAAILAAAKGRGAVAAAASSTRALAGLGVEASLEGDAVLVGSRAFLKARGVCVPGTPPLDPDATLAYVAVRGRYAGAIAASDGPRPEAADAVRRLAAMGIRTSLLSGDRAGPVARAAAAAGITPGRVRHDLSPQAKAGAVAALRSGGPVAMVGDGVNDAPALAEADVGFALGTGADVALEAADVALRNDDLLRVPEALALARRARRVVRQNLAWAAGYNLVAIPVAAAGLLHPIVAAGAMALSSVSVLANSLRLRRA